ncbi:hypothetical protein TruAng_004513 [Truncatella angustata]|nr:hypothetical protein TruAng_004513 [Truncatella angustata]
MLEDAGILRVIKKSLGMSTGPRDVPYYASSKGSAKASKSRTPTTDAYYQLDEDGTPMGDMKATESTEHLHHEKRAASGRIIRTTHLTVNETRDVSDSSDIEHERRKVVPKNAWDM